MKSQLTLIESKVASATTGRQLFTNSERPAIARREARATAAGAKRRQRTRSATQKMSFTLIELLVACQPKPWRLPQAEPQRSKATPTRTGFTLIELLVVITIISILAAMLLPVLSQARYNAKTILNMNNQRTIVQTCLLYASDYNGRFPPEIIPGNNDPVYISNMGMGSQAQFFLPYLPTVTPFFSPFRATWNNNWELWYQTNAPNKRYVSSYAMLWNCDSSWYVDGPNGCWGPRYVDDEEHDSLMIYDFVVRYNTSFLTNQPLRGEGGPATGTWEILWRTKTANGTSQKPQGMRLSAGYRDGHVESFRSGDMQGVNTYYLLPPNYN